MHIFGQLYRLMISFSGLGGGSQRRKKRWWVGKKGSWMVKGNFALVTMSNLEPTTFGGSSTCSIGECKSPLPIYTNIYIAYLWGSLSISICCGFDHWWGNKKSIWSLNFSLFSNSISKFKVIPNQSSTFLALLRNGFIWKNELHVACTRRLYKITTYSRST